MKFMYILVMGTLTFSMHGMEMPSIKITDTNQLFVKKLIAQKIITYDTDEDLNKKGWLWSGAIQAISRFSDDSQTFVAADKETIFIWNKDREKPSKKIKVEVPIKTLVATKDKKIYVSTEYVPYDGHLASLRCYDARTGTMLSRVNRGQYTGRTLSYNPVSKKIAVTDYDELINVYSVNALGEIAKKVESIPYSVDAKWDATGKKLITGPRTSSYMTAGCYGSYGPEMFRKQINKKMQIHSGTFTSTTSFKVPFKPEFCTIEVSAKNIIAIARHHNLVFYDMNNGVITKKFRNNNLFSKLKFDPTGTVLATTDVYREMITLWDMGSYEQIGVIDTQCSIGSFEWMNNGKTLIVNQSVADLIRYDIIPQTIQMPEEKVSSEDPKQEQKIPKESLITLGIKKLSSYKGHRGRIVAISVFPSNTSTFVTAGADKQIHLWRKDFKSPKNTIDVSEWEGISAIACAQYNLLAYATTSYGPSVLVTMNIPPNHSIKTEKNISFQIDTAKTLAWNHDGTVLACSQDGDEYYAFLENKEPQDRYIAEAAHKLIKYRNGGAWTPDGLAFVSGPSSSLDLPFEEDVLNVHTNSFTEVKKVQNTTDIIPFVIKATTNNKIAFISLYDDKVGFCDLESGAMETLEGHTEKIKAIAFDPTGMYLASGDRYGCIKIWDTSTRQIVAELDTEKAISALEWRGESELIVGFDTNNYKHKKNLVSYSIEKKK